MKLFKWIKNIFRKKPKFKVDKTMKGTLWWFNNVDGALEYYTRVIERKPKTEEEKEAILCELVDEGYITRVVQTNRSKEQVIEDLSREQSILQIKPKDDLSKEE